AGPLGGGVEAGSRPPPQIAMAARLGLRKSTEGRFHALWWVPDGAAPNVVRGHLDALQRAEEGLDKDLEKFLPLWKLAVPAEFESYHAWDFQKFGRGERFASQRIPP